MDRYDLTDWLETRPREDAILIAQRAALRVWPIWGAAMDDVLAVEEELSNLSIFWLLLFAGVSRRNLKDFAKEYSWNEFSKRADAFKKLNVTYVVHHNAWVMAAVAADYAAAAAFGNHSRKTLDSFTASVETVVSFPDIWTTEKIIEALWSALANDCKTTDTRGGLLNTPLWHGDMPPELAELESQALYLLTEETGDPNSFWHRWYLSAKEGRWMDWNLQRDVALIPEDIWRQGHAAVATEIAKIEARYAQGIEAEIAALPPAPKSQVAAVKSAMERNRQALPPTFDAIEGFLKLEVERLQQSNDRDAAWDRQMRNYLTLYDAITELRANLPEAGPVTDEQAEQSERLLRLYMRKFTELPRAKVDEVVNGAWETAKGAAQVGLIGTTAALGMAYGLPPMACVAVGTMVFAPKNSVELIKAAREAILPKTLTP